LALLSSPDRLEYNSLSDLRKREDERKAGNAALNKTTFYRPKATKKFLK
jgi:hypothetical protein